MNGIVGPTTQTTGNGVVVSSTIACNSNEVVTGGGFTRSTNINANILSSHKSGNGWTVTATGVSNAANTFQAFAECLTVS